MTTKSVGDGGADVDDLIDELERYVAPRWQPGEREHTGQFHPHRMVVYVAALLGLVALTLPQLLIPDSRVVREAVADAVALSLLLMAVPPIAMIAMHLAKARMNRGEAGAQEIGLAEYYQRIANPLGVLSVLLIGSMVVILSSWAVVPFLIFGVLLMVTTIVLTMNNERRAEQRREAEWPMLLSIPIRWAHLRRELGRLRRKMAAAHKKRRLSREMRDRISTSLTDMGNAVTMLERDARRGRIRWIIEDHHQLLWLYIAWIAVTLGALIAAVAPRFIWIATATTGLSALALALVTVEFGYRRQRWLRRTITQETEGTLAELRDQFEEMANRRG